MIQRIDIFDHKVDPPERLSSWWFSEEHGLSCDNPHAVQLRKDEGMVVPYFMTKTGTWQMVYPNEPKLFFAVLQTHYSGSFVRASSPVIVDQQGGELVK